MRLARFQKTYSPRTTVNKIGSNEAMIESQTLALAGIMSHYCATHRSAYRVYTQETDR